MATGMDPSIPGRYTFTNLINSHEQDLIELARDLGLEMPSHILRILVKLLAEGIHPLALTKLCKDLSKSSSLDKNKFDTVVDKGHE